MPLLRVFYNPGLRERHWKQLSEISSVDLNGSELTFGKLLELEIEKHVENFEPIAEGAAKELSLENALKKMKIEWETVDIPLANYRDSETVFILSNLDEVQALLDDQITKSQTMRSSPFIAPFEDEMKYLKINDDLIFFSLSTF